MQVRRIECIECLKGCTRNIDRGDRYVVGGGMGERHIRERGMGMNVKTWVWKCERKVRGKWRGRCRMN